MEDRRQIIADMKKQGLTFAAITAALIQARVNLRHHLDALQQQFPALAEHQEMHNLEEAIKNYDNLIDLYR